jgi:hypothetical protein
MGVKVLKGDEFVTDGVSIINTDHAAIHKGYGALVDDYITLTSGATKSYCITCPADLYIHFKNIMAQSLAGSCKFEILEGATVTANDGTALDVTQPNDNFDTTPSGTVIADPTYTGGTKIQGFHILADATNQTIGNGKLALSENQELVFKNAGEQYILKITNLEASEIKVAWNAFWYEEPKGKSD